MTSAARLPLAVGWYGKLPSRGDFVGRGLPKAWLRTWDDWLQRSLADASQRWGAAMREHLLDMPPWQGVVLPGQPGAPAWCATADLTFMRPPSPANVKWRSEAGSPAVCRCHPYPRRARE